MFPCQLLFEKDGRELIMAEKKNFLCPYCCLNISYDKSLSNYLEARKKVEKLLIEHKAVCEKKENPVEQKRLLANNETELACKQALADLNKHEEECESDKKIIAVYFSPNRGGSSHADVNAYLANTEDLLIIEQDNLGELASRNY
ncbi:12354_t:CDS:2 [Racocetra fulgida]|uniref:12354_t:CDS:1 n=1 Tax=Racocetra fulgida TaxID=60492 RepID=A0A9N9HYQ1_9GLOM|nr:12354_t:CDS:2 [Racocetra fulgida]